MNRLSTLCLLLAALTLGALTAYGDVTAVFQPSATTRVQLDAEQALASSLRWDDLAITNIPINPTGGTIVPAVLDEDEDFGALTFLGAGAAGTSNNCGGVVQMPHRASHGNVYPHIHLRNKTAGNGTATWQLWYRISSPNGSFPAENTIATLTYAVPVSTQTHQMYYFDPIDTTAYGDSAVVIFRISRLQGNALDTSTTNINLLSFDIHYQTYSAGSVNINGD